MAIEIHRAHFEEIGQLAYHCDKDKLEIAIHEALTFDVEPLMCDMYVYIDDNWDNNDDIWTDIIHGGDYIGCNGRNMRHLGIRKMMLYYIYARYIVLNNFNDTPNGHVTKSNQFSIPKPLKELEQFADKYRSMGYSVWLGVRKFACHNRSNYAFMSNDCTDCECVNGNCGKTKVRGYGIRGKNISKWDV